MSISKKVIKLTYNRDHFEEIYFGNYKGNIFLDPEIKQVFRGFVIALLVLALLVIFRGEFIKNWFFILFVLVVTLALFWGWLSNALIILKWKRDITRFIKKSGEYLNPTLSLSENTLIFSDSDSETIIIWKEISKVDIKKSYIVIHAGEVLILPRKSMNEDDCQFFIDVVRRKVEETDEDIES